MLPMDDELFPVAQAPKHFPGPDPPSVCTFFRWALKGVGRDRVKLQTMKIGGRRYTSQAALERFAAVLTGEEAGRAESTRQRAAAFERAERECRADGL